MAFACPSPGCGSPVGLGDRRCPRCGLAFGPWVLLRAFFQAWLAWVVRLTSLRCPRCRHGSPLRSDRCPHCGQVMTVAAAVEVALTPLRDRWQRWLDGVGPRTIRLFQWSYFSVSVAVLWWLLGYTERKFSTGWIGAVVLSCLYLGVIGLLSALLVPKSVWGAFIVRFSRLMKLSMVVNYLTALLLMQHFIHTWKVRANILACLFVATWCGAWLLCRFLWPIHLQTTTILLGGGGGRTGFDSAAPQGRSVKSG